MTTPISRRTLLRVAGTTSLAALLAACAGDAAPTDDAADAAGDDTMTGLDDGQDITFRAIEAAGLDVAPTLTPIVATFEVLTGAAGRVPFGVLDGTQQPMLDRDVQVWVVSSDTAEVAAGPVTPLFYGEGLGQRGVYVADVEIASAGLYDLVVQVDGDEVGVAALSVRDAADSTSHPPGATFPVVVSPTVAAPGELEALCTRDPQCSMHDTSLDTVLGTGPVVFTVSTPRFCQTAVCGPVLDVVEEMKAAVGRDDITYIHAEVYNDAGVTPTDLVVELGLPSEPWTWVIDADGVVVDRFDGPVVPSLLRAAIDRV